jgi:hypothetical protein
MYSPFSAMPLQADRPQTSTLHDVAQIMKFADHMMGNFGGGGGGGGGSGGFGLLNITGLLGGGLSPFGLGGVGFGFGGFGC